MLEEVIAITEEFLEALKLMQGLKMRVDKPMTYEDLDIDVRTYNAIRWNIPNREHPPSIYALLEMEPTLFKNFGACSFANLCMALRKAGIPKERIVESPMWKAAAHYPYAHRRAEKYL